MMRRDEEMRCEYHKENCYFTSSVTITIITIISSSLFHASVSADSRLLQLTKAQSQAHLGLLLGKGCLGYVTEPLSYGNVCMCCGFAMGKT